MILVFALHWYDFGILKTLVLFGLVVFIAGPVVSGVLFTRLELYFGEALWGYSSILIYPTAAWLALSFSWFGVF